MVIKIKKTVILLLIAASNLLILKAGTLKDSLYGKINFFDKGIGIDKFEKIDLYTLSQKDKINFKNYANTTDNIAAKMYSYLIETNKSGKCHWKFYRANSHYIFFVDCKNIRKNKRYSLFADNTIVKLIPKVHIKLNETIDIKNLSYQSVCCYNRNCAYIIINVKKKIKKIEENRGVK